MFLNKARKQILNTYSGESSSIKPLGVVEDIPVAYQKQDKTLSVIVTSGEGPCLLGKDWLKVLNLDWPSIYGVRKVQSDENLELN